MAINILSKKVNKKYYTIRELSERLNMSYSWTDRKAREGMIVVKWFGGRRCVAIAEVLRIEREGVE